MLLTAIAVQDNGAKMKTEKKVGTSVVSAKPKLPAATAKKAATSCNCMLPSCRVVNHVRSSYPKNLTEVSKRLGSAFAQEIAQI